MTNEEKELLLKDLCGRLPYNVMVQYHYKRGDNCIYEDRELDFSDIETLKYTNEYPQDDWCEISWKPYLRPLSSMTKEEEKEVSRLTGFYKFDCGKEIIRLVNKRPDFPSDWINNVTEGIASSLIDYLNAHHFDYRGLIEKSLALKAPEGMYSK